MSRPLFRKVDCVMFRAEDLDAAVAFYRDRLGHELLWRTAEAVAFALPETDAELVIHSHIGPEVELLVDSVDDAYRALIHAGATSVKPPFEVQIGRCAVVRDPFGNALVIIDQSKGRLVTDAARRVIGVRRSS